MATHAKTNGVNKRNRQTQRFSLVATSRTFCCSSPFGSSSRFVCPLRKHRCCRRRRMKLPRRRHLKRECYRRPTVGLVGIVDNVVGGGKQTTNRHQTESRKRPDSGQTAARQSPRAKNLSVDTYYLMYVRNIFEANMKPI